MRLVVGVYFDVLVGDFLLFEDGPGALDEGAAFEECVRSLLVVVVVGNGREWGFFWFF